MIETGRNRVCGLLVLLGLVAGAGCVSALREPGGLPETTNYGPHEVDGLLDQAQELYDQQQLSAMDRAADLWLSAAVADPDRIEGIIGAVRARIWSATNAKGSGRREAYSSRAVETAQACEPRAPDDPLCAYWLALALGVQAQERRWTARDGIPIMIELLEKVAAANPDLDHAGPYRVLGLVYVRAPGWPAGPGDPDQALEYARKAAERSPEYPPNQLCLAEALRATGDEQASLEIYRKAEEMAQDWANRGDLDAEDWLAEARRELTRD